MLRRSLCLISLFALLCWPSSIEEATSLLTKIRQPEWIETEAIVDYLALLERRGVDLGDQGVLVESLDGSLIYAEHQSGQTFNPASVIKIATTLAALERFGAEHRFETALYIDGLIEQGTLHGDLILASDGDPVMATADLTRLAREAIRAGIRQVDGSFIISGPFTVGNLHRQNQVATYVVRTLRRIGIRVPDHVSYDQARGIEIAKHESPPLIDILFEQNAHSDNVTADRLGEAIGGRRELESYLIDEIGIPAEDIHIGRASGLRINRMTPKGTIMVLRKMARWLNDRGMYPEDILPVAGVDQGTTRLRFNNGRYRGAVVAKTGTLISTDEGVSAFAGFLYTEDQGPLLFAILNTHGPVIQYRRFQDEFVRNLLNEYGGRAKSNGQTHRAAS